MAVGMAVEERLGVVMEKLHREMDALEISAFDGEVARLGRAGAEDHGVELLEQLLGGKILADLGIADELHAFGFEQLDAPEHDLLLVELHVRDAMVRRPPGRSARS
jgi:hypothetical protein